MINALVNAARNGKHVEVVVELAARFDEKQNIRISNMLKEAGWWSVWDSQVEGARQAILITRNQGRVRRYAHIGTGNFHEKTAGVYEDLSLLTAHSDLTKEVAKIFDFLKAASSASSTSCCS